MELDNYLKIFLPARSQNEALARIAVAAFVSQLDPTLDELTDIKTAVSEAVTNAIIHGYEHKDGEVMLYSEYIGRTITVIVKDKGDGIANIEQARQPLYTSKPELERSGMGFTVMETFMDEVRIESKLNEGTSVIMKKRLQPAKG